MSKFDARAIAEGTMDRCCEGDPWPTARNLACFLTALCAVAARRCLSRLRHQPLSAVRWRRDPKYGGRA